jgi:flagellar protein FlbT
MSHLILELHAGEAMIVNGASLRFRTRSRVELTTHARFLFGKQIMAPEDADSPARRIYFALQMAYIGADQERPQGVTQARDAIREFQAVTTSPLALVEADECYAAFKLARRIMRHEDGVLGRTPEMARPGPLPAAPARPDRPHDAPALHLTSVPA